MKAKGLVATLAVFALAGACVLGAGALAQGDKAALAPQSVTHESPCPATGCASGSCHGFDDVPEPDGIHEMICPETGCASVECHAWNTLRGGYRQASDASLNVWILMPVALVVVLTLVMKRVR